MATQEISTSNVFGYFIQDKKHKSSSRFVSIGEPDREGEHMVIDPDVRIVASCNQGNLCLVINLKGGDDRYYVAKLSTQQWEAIPNPKDVNDNELKGIMVLPSSDDSLRFAIISLTSKGDMEKRNAAYECEIFDSKFWTWRRHDDLIMRTSSEYIVHSPGVSFRSCVYWLTSEDNVVDLHFDKKGDVFKFEYIKTNAKKNKYMKLVECDTRRDVRLLGCRYNNYLKLAYILLTEEDVLELCVMSKKVDYTMFDGEEGQIWSIKTTILEEMETRSFEVGNLKQQEDEVIYSVDNIEKLERFEEFICYEEWGWTTDHLIRLHQLNVAEDVFRMRLDSSPIVLRPTLSEDAKKSR